MDIWITICRKTVTCAYCQEPIHLGEVMVAGRIWRSKEGGARRWVKNFRWHAQKLVESNEDISGSESKQTVVCCWLEAGLAYLKDHPPVETRGRHQLQLTKKQKDERLKILRQRARLVQKLKFYMEIPLRYQSEEDVAAIIKLGSQIQELRERIEPLGGVPKSWE